MFCIACGKAIIEGTRFCGHCGAKLFVPPPSSASVASTPVPVESEPPTVDHPSGRDASVSPVPTAERGGAPATPHFAPPAPTAIPRSDVPAVVPTIPPPIATPTAEPAPMLFGEVAQPETTSGPPAFLLLGGGVGVLLGVGLVIAGFWKTPWLVVPGFLVCVVGFGVMLRRFSRAMAVLGGVLLAVLMTFATGLPFGGIGRLRALRTAIDTAGLPALPAGYQYLTEAGEEIDMVTYVVPEKGGEARRSYTFLERESGGFRMNIVIAPEGEPPTLWRTSGEALRAGRPAPLPTGTIRVAGDLLLSSEGSGDFLFDSVPRRFVPGRWVRVERSSQRAAFEQGGLKVHEMLVGIVACREAGGTAKNRSLVVMWRMDLESRNTGERNVAYLVSEFTEGVGLSQSGSVKKGERWTASLYRDWVQTSHDTKIERPTVAPQPVAGGEGQPVEPEGSPRPVSDGDTESNGVPVSPSSEATTLSKTEPASVPSEPDEPMRVGGDVKEPVEISRVQPIYPEAARKMRIQGIVTLEAIISKEGTVKSVRVLRGVDPLLDNASMRAVQQWKYQPATFEGRPVPVYLTVRMTFGLEPPPDRPVLPSPSAVSPDSRSGDQMTAVKWVPIPDGEFTMGCTSGDGECVDYEKPSHRVMLRRGFQMAATETTNAQYRSCVEAGACGAPSPQGVFDDSSKREHPVVNVSWENAAGFCRWAGGRLPTEVEWEFAARGGREGSRYPWGNEIAEANAKFGGGGTRPVCSYPPNSFGLFDMAGNVREWCADWFDGRYYSLSLWLAPKGPASGSERVLRGGSWESRPTFLRVSYRDALNPRIAHTDLGFRCVREAKAP